MKSDILLKFKNRIITSILYISLFLIFIPIYYYYNNLPFYKSPGLYIPFIALFLLILVKKKSNLVPIRNIIITIAFIVQVYLLMNSTETMNKMFFLPISIFIFYSLLDKKWASILTGSLVLLIIFHHNFYTTYISNYNFYALIISAIMMALIFISIYSLIQKLSNQANRLFKKLRVINEDLNQKVLHKTKEIQLSNTILNSVLNSHDDLVILLNQTDTVIANDKFNEYFSTQNYSLFELLEENKIDLTQDTIIRSNKITHNGATFLLNKKNIKIENELYTLITLTDISSFNSQVETLKQQAHVDNLTSLKNRVLFEQVTNNLLEQAQTQNQLFALIMFDIDNFKSVNDTYGHSEGDKVLQEVADFVSEHIRSGDLLFRWGGDEFFLVIKGTDSLHSYDISEKIRNAFLETVTAKKYNISISFGMSIFKNNDSIKTITKRVDDALYESKQNGKNRSTIL